MAQTDVALLLLLFLPCVPLLSCTERERASSEWVPDLATYAPTKSDERVILVTIDGARWQDVFEGSNPAWSGEVHVDARELMPRTYALLETKGVALGADRAGCGLVHTASGVNVSLPGYHEIFTGRPSFCLDNECAPVRSSILDEAAAAKVDGVATIGSWQQLHRVVSAGRPDVFVAEGKTWPQAPAGIHAQSFSPELADLAVEGADADPMPGQNDYRPDERTASIALAYLRELRPAFLHIGLGDTDEWGHRGEYVAYLDALHRADALIGDLADEIERLGERGRKTTLIVTPDHGRNADFRDHGALHPESGRTFLLLFGERVTERGIGCPRRDISLADIAPTIRKLLALPADPGETAGQPIDEIL